MAFLSGFSKNEFTQFSLSEINTEWFGRATTNIINDHVVEAQHFQIHPLYDKKYSLQEANGKVKLSRCGCTLTVEKPVLLQSLDVISVGSSFFIFHFEPLDPEKELKSNTFLSEDCRKVLKRLQEFWANNKSYVLVGKKDSNLQIIETAKKNKTADTNTTQLTGQSAPLMSHDESGMDMVTVRGFPTPRSFVSLDGGWKSKGGCHNSLSNCTSYRPEAVNEVNQSDLKKLRTLTDEQTFSRLKELNGIFPYEEFLGIIVAEKFHLSYEQKEELFSTLANYLNSNRSAVKKSLEAVPSQLLFLAAVFFVRYDYTYNSGGFWDPLIDKLELSNTQSTRKLIARKFDSFFERRKLPKACGGYKYVSSIIFHSILPDDGIERFAEIIASEKDNWHFYRDASNNLIKNVISSYTYNTTANFKRLISNEHTSNLVVGLFRDTCSFLADGDSNSTSSSGLDVPKISSMVLATLENGKHSASSRLREYNEWNTITPFWLWNKATHRIGLEFGRILVPATITVGEIAFSCGGWQKNFSIEDVRKVDFSFFLDSYYIDSSIEDLTLSIKHNGSEVLSVDIPLLNFNIPIMEINGSLVNPDNSQKIPPVGYWLLPKNTFFSSQSNLLLQDFPRPYPCTGGTAVWIDAGRGATEVKLDCEHGKIQVFDIDRCTSWHLCKGELSTNVYFDWPNTPTYTKAPELHLFHSQGKGLTLQVNNLSSGERYYQNLDDLAAVDLTHQDICSQVNCHWGIFEFKVKAANGRSVTGMKVLRYAILPFEGVKLPVALLPDQHFVELEALTNVANLSYSCDSGEIVEEKSQLQIKWDNELDINRFIVNGNKINVYVPRVQWRFEDIVSPTVIHLNEEDLLTYGRTIQIATASQVINVLGNDEVVFESKETNNSFPISLNQLFSIVANSSEPLVDFKLAINGHSFDFISVRRNFVVHCCDISYTNSGMIIEGDLSRKLNENLSLLLFNKSKPNIEQKLFHLDTDGTRFTGTVDFEKEDLPHGEYSFFVCYGDYEQAPLGAFGIIENKRQVINSFKYPKKLKYLELNGATPGPKALINCGRYGLPVTNILKLDLLGNSGEGFVEKSQLMVGSVKALVEYDGYTGRKIIQNLMEQGLNFSELSNFKFKNEEWGASADKLLDLWQPLGVLSLFGEFSCWTDKADRLIGKLDSISCWLPVSSVIRVEGEKFRIVSTPVLDVESFNNFYKVEVESQITSNRSVLYINSIRHNLCFIANSEDELNSDALVPFERLVIKNCELFGIQKNDALCIEAVARCYLSGETAHPHLLIPFVEAENTKPPVCSKGFFLKAVWDLMKRAKDDNDVKTFIDNSEGLHVWFREHIGCEDFQGNHRIKFVFEELLRSSVQELIINQSKIIEQLFPFHSDFGQVISYVFCVAFYNRLCARKAGRVVDIRPHKGGLEWLREESTKCYKYARLLFNYFLIHAEAVLALWNDQD